MLNLKSIYTNQLSSTTFHGYGTCGSYAVNGTSCDCEYKDGVFHGARTLTSTNGFKLVGEFHHCHLHGQGKRICPDGHVSIVDFGEREHDDDCSGCSHHH